MFDVILFQPEIPPNTGNIIRLCANTGARLHLIEPLGFRLEDRLLRRAGLDYHEWVRLQVHPDLAACRAALAPGRLWAFSTRGEVNYAEVTYTSGDALLFGPETRGLPGCLLEALPPGQRLYLPMAPGNRSLNLSNAVAVALFEAWRQQGFAGARVQDSASMAGAG
ncbi:MAG: tRNA (cytidine(34)-2'-O)-methyltransferase [Chromatiaceae bacterium]|nr:MAG: tRNA (cytidine(34)-2'-O)-methyltransferase [Chromatiaceae bacterium]